MIDLMVIATVEDEEEKRRYLKQYVEQFTDDEKRQLLEFMKAFHIGEAQSESGK